VETDQRTRLVQGIDRQNQSTAALQRIERLGEENEAIGIGVTTDLQVQREQIVRSTDRLKQTDGVLDSARNILNDMWRRAMSSKILLVVTIVLLLAVNGGVAYKKFGT
jgi:hypothetical protein